MTEELLSMPQAETAVRIARDPEICEALSGADMEKETDR
jgi:hypothetical protein